jgi:transcriptional antiterminator NusG
LRQFARLSLPAAAVRNLIAHCTLRHNRCKFLHLWHGNFKLASEARNHYKSSSWFCRQDVPTSSRTLPAGASLSCVQVLVVQINGTEKSGASQICEGIPIPDHNHEWYAVTTRSRQEKVAANILENIGITAFLPLVEEVHRWSDRNKTVRVPLFSSYLFVQIPRSRESQVRVLQAPGVVSFVGNHSGPLTIPQKEIDDVRSVLSGEVKYSPYPYLQAGDRVRIVGGALDGVEGTLLSRGADTKLVISIELIQRSLAVSVYGYDVIPVVKPHGVAA